MNDQYYHVNVYVVACCRIFFPASWIIFNYISNYILLINSSVLGDWITCIIFFLWIILFWILNVNISSRIYFQLFWVKSISVIPGSYDNSNVIYLFLNFTCVRRERQRENEIKGENLPSTDSLSKCPQRRILGQVQSVSWILDSGLSRCLQGNKYLNIGIPGYTLSGS